MRFRFQRTLVGRVVLTILAAFLSIWVVLALVEFAEIRVGENDNPSLKQTAREVAAILDAVDDPMVARSIVAALDRTTTQLRQQQDNPTINWFFLRDRRDGKILFISAGAGDQFPVSSPAHQVVQTFRGVTLHAQEATTSRWFLVISQSNLDRNWIFREVGAELLKYLLIAFPFILVPVWLAVSQGLRPLRRLSKRLGAREPDDLSPVGFNTRYAELKPVITALDNLLNKLRGRIEREQAFFQDAAHELRTPMAVIAAQAHALDKADDEEAHREAMLRLEQAMNRASHLVEQLLALAQLGADQAPVRTRVDLAELVRSEMSKLDPVAARRGIECSLEAPDQLPQKLEVPAFMSILHNLLDNAIRYGRDRGHVLVELRESNQSVMLAVNDDGVGITEHDRANIFDRFCRGTNHDESGTGLGLAIVKQAASRLGGEVTLEVGLEGRGCRFVVGFPSAR